MVGLLPVLNEPAGLVTFDDIMGYEDPSVSFFPQQAYWHEHVDPIALLHTNGRTPLEGYLVDDDGDNQTDLLVVLDNGAAWTVYGPLTTQLIAYLY